MSLNILIPQQVLAVGQSTSILMRPVIKESMTVTLTVAGLGIATDAQVRILIEDLTSPEKRPAIETVNGTGSAIIRLEPTPTSIRITVFAMAGQARIAVYEEITSIVADQVEAEGYSAPFRQVVASSSDTTIDLSLGHNIYLLLNSSTTLTLLNPQNGERYLFWIVNGGSNTLSWPSGSGGVVWKGGSPPVMTSGVGKQDLVCIIYNGIAGKYGGSSDADFS